ncbi:MAG: deoxyribodipyrimidine photolyase [Syntrophaceae bacterium]|nr:deoxyribodipyrimidine photolyase [Syntrophaceae bacterium]
MIHPERITPLNRKSPGKGRWVLYWMQASQRASWNHALEFALREANGLDLPVVVFFGLTPDFPEANLRHYRFLLEGLREVQNDLGKRGIALVVRAVSPERGALELCGDAALAVTDRGYLHIQKAWREAVAREAPCPLLQVESDAIVPVESASAKEEFSAATLRPKIRALLPDFLHPLEETPAKRDSLGLRLPGLSLEDPEAILRALPLNRSVPPIDSLRGGSSEGRRRLERFLAHALDRYHTDRNVPGSNAVSDLSPYLHFGHLSPLEVALAVRASRHGNPAAKESFLEELIVRRELALNFVHYNPAYDAYEGAVPAWARRTLEEHARDRREYLYGLRDLEEGHTHDPFWNAAQREMVRTGKMHNYMRMYWGKKILEWSVSPSEAFRTALVLNNRWELDGRDPNGFAGVAWCFGKHDRPWGERPIFGKVRYMNAAGLKRKFDMGPYLERFG